MIRIYAAVYNLVCVDGIVIVRYCHVNYNLFFWKMFIVKKAEFDHKMFM